jgi:uncharacterized protein YdhG (YjbR/CyaY superfamily)
MKSDQAAPRDVDEYIAGFPPEIQEILEHIRRTIKRAAPDAQETIKYRMPTFSLNGSFLHFAAYKSHIGVYPAPRANEEFKHELSLYPGDKSTVRFPLDQPIPYALIARIAEFRARKSLEAEVTKRKKP